MMSFFLALYSLHQASGGNALVVMAEAVMSRFDLFSRLGIDKTKFTNLLTAIQGGYHDCLYHNSVHAADVTHASHCLIWENHLWREIPDEELLAYLLSGPMHDVGHPGRTLPKRASIHASREN